MDVREYRELDAVALAGLVRRGEVGAGELAAAANAAIDEENGVINAVVHRFPERAAAALGAGLPDGPLRGVPLLLKDQLEVAGTPINYGSRLLDGYLCPRTHPLAARLEAAGALFLGRTNMSEMGFTPTTEPARFGATRNPWDLGRSPGGSSGGAAAAVAAGFVPVAHAVDGGGSIRIPAAACGLVGLKPSRGRVVTAPDDDPDGFVSHHCVSHTVRDSAAVLDVLAGGGGRWALPAPAIPYAEGVRRESPRLRVGVCAVGLYGERLHPAAEAAVLTTARRLESLGHAVEPVPPPVDAERLTEAMRVLWSAGAGVFLRLAQRGVGQSALPAFVKALLAHPALFRLAIALPLGGAPLVEAFTRRLGRIDAGCTPSDLWLAGVALQEAAAALAAQFAHHDLLLTPVLTRPPDPLGTLDLSGSDAAITCRLFEYVAFTPVANATGLPAISVPGPPDPVTGLPMGAHLMAPMGREDWLLGVAAQIERGWPWPRVWARAAAGTAGAGLAPSPGLAAA